MGAPYIYDISHLRVKYNDKVFSELKCRTGQLRVELTAALLEANSELYAVATSCSSCTAQQPDIWP